VYKLNTQRYGSSPKLLNGFQLNLVLVFYISAAGRISFGPHRSNICYLFFYVGVKLGLWLYGRNTDRRCL